MTTRINYAGHSASDMKNELLKITNKIIDKKD
jgi:hypothetical protein